jgi:DNA-binding CsgD family transcriptional regulator
MQKLTRRQNEIMQLLMAGYTTEEIADMCGGIVPGTVRVHVRNACKALNAKTLIQCVAMIAKAEATIKRKRLGAVCLGDRLLSRLLVCYGVYSLTFVTGRVTEK